MQRSLLGEQLGNYRLTGLLGRGGFAEVYLGEHTRFNSKAAIKVLHPHLLSEQSAEFYREAQVSASLNHPHIVRVLDYDVQKGFPFLVMDYYPAGTVRQAYPRGQVIAVETIASYTRQIASALQYAHDRKLIHRDVKPENMLIGPQGELALSDFGIAIMMHSTVSMSTQAPIGTIAYMAPEQIQAQAQPASDQYALAIAVYEWLCGKHPFGGSYLEMLARHLSAAPPSLSQQGFSPAIERVVLTALAKDPHQRYTSIQEFAYALEEATQQEPVRGFPAGETTIVASPATPPAGGPEQTTSAAGASVADVRTTAQATPLAPLSPSLASATPPASHMVTHPILLQELGSARKAPAKRRLNSISILIGIVILLLLSSLAILIPAFNTYSNGLAGQHVGTATAFTGTATASADRATSVAQQTAAVIYKYATETVAPHATATAVVRDRLPGYFVGAGKIFYNEALDAPGAWQPQADSHGGSCQFANNAYHIAESSVGNGFICADLNIVSGGNEQVEVEVMFVKGDCAALHIRYRINSGDTYPFRVCSNGSAQIADHTGGHDIILGAVGPRSFALQSSWNRIGLEVTVNNAIIGYVNGKRVLTVNDDGVSRIGNFALEAISLNAPTEVIYRNLRAWGSN